MHSLVENFTKYKDFSNSKRTWLTTNPSAYRETWCCLVHFKKQPECTLCNFPKTSELSLPAFTWLLQNWILASSKFSLGGVFCLDSPFSSLKILLLLQLNLILQVWCKHPLLCKILQVPSLYWPPPPSPVPGYICSHAL